MITEVDLRVWSISRAWTGAHIERDYMRDAGRAEDMAYAEKFHRDVNHAARSASPLQIEYDRLFYDGYARITVADAEVLAYTERDRRRP